MREDLVPGNAFPDIRLPDHTGRPLVLSEIAKAQPLVLCFVRGWWCPKEQVRLAAGRGAGRRRGRRARRCGPRGRERARDVPAGVRRRRPAGGRRGGPVPRRRAAVAPPRSGRRRERLALHLRKGGEPDRTRYVRHHLTAPHHVR
jgi:hypothetical protein